MEMAADVIGTVGRVSGRCSPLSIEGVKDGLFV